MRDTKSVYTYSKLENDEVVMFKGGIYIPIVLRERILNWCYLYIYHPGGTLLGKTLQ